MPYKDDRDRCESNIQYLKDLITKARREARKIPRLEAEIKRWKARIKENRRPDGRKVQPQLVKKSASAEERLQAAKSQLQFWRERYFIDRNPDNGSRSIKPRHGLAVSKHNQLARLADKVNVRKIDIRKSYREVGYGWVKTGRYEATIYRYRFDTSKES